MLRNRDIGMCAAIDAGLNMRIFQCEDQDDIFYKLVLRWLKAGQGVQASAAAEVAHYQRERALETRA